MTDVAVESPEGRRLELGALLGTLLGILYLGALAGLAAAVIAWGGDYWFLPRDLRADHPLHAWLRPGGPVGLWMGLVGTVLMVIMLIYSVRKVVPRVRWLGPVPAWLRFHMICGVMGPVFIVIHEGFMVPRGVIAIGFWCMVLVAVSGVFGRYVYGFFPSSAAGRVEDFDETREALALLREDLVTVTAHTGGDIAPVQEAIALTRDLKRPRTAFGLVPMGWSVRRRGRRIRRLLAQSDLEPWLRRRITRDLVGQLRLVRSLATWEVTGRMLRYWHLFHLPLAKAMYAIIVIHVATALLFGGLAGLWEWPGVAP